MNPFKKKLNKYRTLVNDFRRLKERAESSPIDLRQQVTRTEAELADTAAEIGRALAALPLYERQVLELRYLQLLPTGRQRAWTSIAEMLGYSTSHVLRLHRQALEHAQAIMEQR